MSTEKWSAFAAATSVGASDALVGLQGGVNKRFPQSVIGGGLLRVTVPLNNAQIKALPSTDIELVAAPGLGKFILPLYAFLISDFAVAYSGIDANTNYPSLWVSHSSSPIYLQEFIDQPEAEGQSSLTTFLTQTNEFGRGGWTLLPPQSSFLNVTGKQGLTYPSAPFLPDEQANLSLNIGADNSIDFTGGDAANTLKVTVLYTVIDL